MSLSMKYEKKFKNKKQFLNQYEDVASNYDHNRLKDFEGKKVLKTQIKLLDKIINNKKPKKILEAGCGTGRILIPLTKRGHNIEGFDLSKNMLSELKKKNSKIKTKVGDIEKIPYNDNTFDLVYSITVLIHLPKINKAIDEMMRVTKKGGYVVFDLSNKTSIWTKLSVLFEPNKKRTTLYTKKDIKKILKNKNYEITGIFSYARTFYKIPVLRNFVSFLDDFVPLPVSMRTQYIVIIQKR